MLRDKRTNTRTAGSLFFNIIGNLLLSLFLIVVINGRTFKIEMQRFIRFFIVRTYVKQIDVLQLDFESTKINHAQALQEKSVL